MRGLFVTLLALSLAQFVSARDLMTIEVAGTANGTVVIELRDDLAPNHVAQIKELANSGFYNDVAFHRVIDGFMAQTGDGQNAKIDSYDARLAGTGGSSRPDLQAEFSNGTYVKGTVGMARSASPHSANSQFFIMFAPAPFLDGEYTIIGNVVAGQEVVDAIKRGEGPSFTGPDYMKTVTITTVE